MLSDQSLDEIYSQFTSFIVVDLDAILHNAQAILTHTGPTVEVFGVVKANAYGHGAVPVARALLDAGIPRLAVGRTDEGLQLRRASIDVPILNLCYTVSAEAETMVAHDLTATVNTLEGAQVLSARAEALGKTATIHIKVDTGMGRYGQLPGEVLPFLAAINGLPNLDLEGIYTHFAVADATDKTYTHQQFAAFQEVLAAVSEAGYSFRMRHAANSAATLDLPETHLDAVRPGIILYGLYPSPDVSTDIPLQPALSLHSHLARVRTLPPSSSVGYGRTFITDQATPIGLVPVGYGDGYHRLLSNRGTVLVNGQRAPIAGRVCMDQFMVDLSAVPIAAQDNRVVLLGEQGAACIPAEEIAAEAETINYEVVTGLTRRLPRIYLQNGQVVEILRLP